jgi:hypothetical protein
MSATVRKRPAVNYFTRYRLEGDTIAAKVSRAQLAAATRPRPSLARLRWLEMPFWNDTPSLDAHIAAVRSSS